MRGICSKCKEYRSDNGCDAWKILWKNGLGLCEKCGHVVDVWMNNGDSQPAGEEVEDDEIFPF